MVGVNLGCTGQYAYGSSWKLAGPELCGGFSRTVQAVQFKAKGVTESVTIDTLLYRPVTVAVAHDMLEACLTKTHTLQIAADFLVQMHLATVMQLLRHDVASYWTGLGSKCVAAGLSQCDTSMTAQADGTLCDCHIAHGPVHNTFGKTLSYQKVTTHI